jgi:hypothetical protein
MGLLKGPGLHPAAGLWWTAILVAVIGGAITYALSLDRFTPGFRVRMSVSLMITILGAGICVIAATANWWLKR